MRRAAFVYDDQVSRHVLREDHVMRPTRLRYTHDLLDAYGAFERSDKVAPRPASLDELGWFHTVEYVRAVQEISGGEDGVTPERYNFSAHGDNPPYEGMFEASALSTGGSLVAAELVAEAVWTWLSTSPAGCITPRRATPPASVSSTIRSLPSRRCAAAACE